MSKQRKIRRWLDRLVRGFVHRQFEPRLLEPTGVAAGVVTGVVTGVEACKRACSNDTHNEAYNVVVRKSSKISTYKAGRIAQLV